MDQPDTLVIGAGPAGLMAADTLAEAGLSVLIADQMPSPGRKFLMAGKSGLNLTKHEPLAEMLGRYDSPWMARMVSDFGPEAVQAWAASLGQETFVGSTGRVFPTAMKASPLLRAWLARLETLGVRLERRWRFTSWDGDALCFETPQGSRQVTPKATVLALGGGSWARLGSDGRWLQNPDLEPHSVSFQPSNTGLSVPWSAHMVKHFGAPLKSVALQCGDSVSRGEITLSQHGLEGGGLYPLSPGLRAGQPLTVDLKPDLCLDALRARLLKRRPKDSLSTHLRKSLRLFAVAVALLQEMARPLPDDLAPLLKALPIKHEGFRPLDEAISTVGGLRKEALDEGLMLLDRPGTFACGEMIDWDAPTGGYLITGCLASGKWAGRHAAEWVRQKI